GRLLFHAPADFADHDDRRGARIRIERHQRITGGRPNHRITADANERRLAETGLGEIETYQSAQTAAAGDDADPSWLEHGRIVARHDADEAFSGGDDAGRVRSDQTGVCAA